MQQQEIRPPFGTPAGEPKPFAPLTDADLAVAQWIEHGGYGLPPALGKEGVRVCIQRRNGSSFEGPPFSFAGWDRQPGRGSIIPIIESEYDIMRYRIVNAGADDDGWIEHSGGVIPVGPRAFVEVKFKSGIIAADAAGMWDWDHDDTGHDIVAYRAWISAPPPKWVRADSGARNEIMSAELERDHAMRATLLASGVSAHTTHSERLARFEESQSVTARIAAMDRAGEIMRSGLADRRNTAPHLLGKARQHMEERAATYDQPEGERSMAATVTMFNTATGRDLSESEGWLLMQCLKMVRDRSRKEPHVDSIEDNIAYSALYGEARLREAQS